jgi:hypothetical protein
MNFKSFGYLQAQKDNPGKYRTRLFGGVLKVVIYVYTTVEDEPIKY